MRRIFDRKLGMVTEVYRTRFELIEALVNIAVFGGSTIRDIKRDIDLPDEDPSELKDIWANAAYRYNVVKNGLKRQGRLAEFGYC